MFSVSDSDRLLYIIVMNSVKRAVSCVCWNDGCDSVDMDFMLFFGVRLTTGTVCIVCPKTVSHRDGPSSNQFGASGRRLYEKLNLFIRMKWCAVG